MTDTTVSVIIPIYNDRHHIRKAVESVLRQNLSLELIIVDDCSGDFPEEVISDYLLYENVVYIKNEKNLGVSVSRNIGVQVARGQYIAYLDSDDWWADGKLSKQVQIMKDDRWVICHTARELMNDYGDPINRIIPVEEEVDYRKLLRHNSIACSSVLLPRNVALEMPMAHDDCHEDYLTWLKILKKYGTAYGLNEPLLMYRLSNTGKSRNRLKSAKMTYRVHRYMNKGLISSLFYMSCHLAHGLKKYGFWNSKQYRGCTEEGTTLDEHNVASKTLNL